MCWCWLLLSLKLSLGVGCIILRTNLKKHNNRHVYTYIHLHNFENPQKQLKLPGINVTYAMSHVNEQDASGANAMMSMSRGEVSNTVNSTGGRSSLSSGKSAYRRSGGGMPRGWLGNSMWWWIKAARQCVHTGKEKVKRMWLRWMMTLCLWTVKNWRQD